MTVALWASAPPTARVLRATTDDHSLPNSPAADVLTVQSQLHQVALLVSATFTAQASVVCSTIPCPCRQTIRERLGERRRRDPIFSRSVCWFGAVQLPSVVGTPRYCPRWVHGPCQLPDQLALHTISFQETQSPLMGTLPTDEPLWYDGPVGTNGCEVGFLFHSSVDACPIPGSADQKSLRWCLVAGATCVCSVLRSTCRHRNRCTCGILACACGLRAFVSRSPSLVALCFWLATPTSVPVFPTWTVARGRLTTVANCPGDMQSHGAGAPQPSGLPNPPLWRIILTQIPFQIMILFTSGPIVAQSRHYHLLASDHMLCSCHVSLPQALSFTGPDLTSTPCSWLALRALVLPLGISLSWLSIHTLAPTSLDVLPWTLFHALTQILLEGVSLHSRRRTTTTLNTPRQRQPLWWNDACFHALVARSGSQRDFRCCGSSVDQARFRTLRQQFHSTVRSTMSSYWNAWPSSVHSLSLSHRDPRLASALIRRTFRAPSATSDLCNVQWSVGGAICFSLFNLILQYAVAPSVWRSSLVVPVIKRDGGPTSLDSLRPISLASCAFKVLEHLVHAWSADVMAFSIRDSLRLHSHVHTSSTSRKPLTRHGSKRPWSVFTTSGVSGRLWHLPTSTAVHCPK